MPLPDDQRPNIEQRAADLAWGVLGNLVTASLLYLFAIAFGYLQGTPPLVLAACAVALGGLLGGPLGGVLRRRGVDQKRITWAAVGLGVTLGVIAKLLSG